jgi:hypothetical protein
VINDCSSAARLGHPGYERARTLFSIEKNVRELCALLTFVATGLWPVDG